LEQTIAGLQIPVAVLTKDLRYLAFSPPWRKIFSTSQARVILGSALNLRSNSFSEQWLKALECALQTGDQGPHRAILQVREGKLMHLRWHWHPWTAGSVPEAIVLYVQDMTPVMRIKERLDKTISALKQSNEELERYAHMCAHDLKEPLRSIAIFAQLLERESPELTPQSKAYLAHISEGSHRMKAMIEDMLVHAQSGQTPGVREPIDLTLMLRDVESDLNALILEKHGVIQTQGLGVIYGDKLQIRRLFQNLIGNGLKFNDKAEAVVRISMTETKTHWEFVVEDNGIGIDARYVKKVFQLFYRLENRREYQGSGLGLSTAKKIVEQHGGEIWVQSTKNRGSAFYFTLAKG